MKTKEDKRVFVPYIVRITRSHWLIRGHMTSNNKTVSRQKSLSGQLDSASGNIEILGKQN
jgi:hypothetical protein